MISNRLKKILLTIVIPSFNEAECLKGFLSQLLNVTQQYGWKIIVINDASTDQTDEVLHSFGNTIMVLKNDPNLGYGASLKRGILAASTPWVACMDADGQHRIEDLIKMADMLDNADAIIGERMAASHAPISRRPGKWLMYRVAKLLTGKDVKDLNCGLRIFRRDIVMQLFSICSDRFSFSTSTTVALLQLGFRVKFAPVLVERRMGKSSVRQVRDGLDAILRIVRLVCLFHPLRIFLPLGIAMLCVGFLRCINDIFFVTPPHIQSSTLLLSINGLVIFFMALLADLIAGLRRDMLFTQPSKTNFSGAEIYDRKLSEGEEK